MRRKLTLATLMIAGSYCSAVGAEGYPTDDPSLRLYQETTAQYLNRCKGDLSHVEQSSCYSDQIKALKIRVSSEFKKRLIDAEAEKAESEHGGKTGEERSKILAANLKRAQSAWQNYTKAECDRALEESEMGGGNGGDLVYGSCMIRHLVARYNELRR